MGPHRNCLGSRFPWSAACGSWFGTSVPVHRNRLWPATCWASTTFLHLVSPSLGERVGPTLRPAPPWASSLLAASAGLLLRQTLVTQLAAARLAVLLVVVRRGPVRAVLAPMPSVAALTLSICHSISPPYGVNSSCSGAKKLPHLPYMLLRMKN